MFLPPSQLSARATRPSTSEQAAVGDDIRAIDRIVDAAIDAAPDCVRRRLILPSLDWRAVPATKVARMMSLLKQSGVACPRWLAKAVLLAGHVTEEEQHQNLSAHLKLLNRINQASLHGETGVEIGPLVDGLMDDATIETEIIGAIVPRLIKIGCSRQAVRLALAHSHRTQDPLRAVVAQLDAVLRELPAVRLRVTGFSTTQLFAAALGPAFAARDWRADVSQAEFGVALSELAKPDVGHDALLLLLDLDGFAPFDWRNPPARVAELLSERAELLAGALAAFAERSEVPLFINTLPCAPAPTAGLLDWRHAAGLRRAIEVVNARILDAAGLSSKIVVIDGDEALAEIALSRHVDQKLWFYGRIAYSVEATRALAGAFARAWRLLFQGPVKVLAVDLDNTLWGGIYGDDGVERLASGQEFPGNAFLAMQQECLRLRSQGILLVALSKNNADAISAFERHPGMVLKPSDFSALAVNWEPKPQNIRKVAAELNLGLDSFLFIDDSPQERDAMRRQCPEVRTPEMPADPAERPLWLRRQACTWPVRLTAEDEARQALYATGREASQWKAIAGSQEDFLRGLEQRLTVGHVRAETVARIAQMHERTNQFNLTTVRSTEADIAAMAAEAWPGIVLYGRASDRFGDHGIVIAAVAEIVGGEAFLRSFLMSCRVIGREVERAFLGELLRELAWRGVSRVYGEYIPTAKNAMVRDFYPTSGFARVEADEGAGTNWVLSLSNTELPGSQFVTVVWEA